MDKLDNSKKLKANVLDDHQHGNKALYLAGLVIGLWGPFVGATAVLFYLAKVSFRIEDWVEPVYDYLIKGL